MSGKPASFFPLRTKLTIWKVSSRRRHTVYCCRGGGQPVTRAPRKKSCQACTKAKARCDVSIPTCYRCKQRSQECVYSNREPSEVSRKTSQNSGRDMPVNDLVTAVSPLSPRRIESLWNSSNCSTFPTIAEIHKPNPVIDWDFDLSGEMDPMVIEATADDIVTTQFSITTWDDNSTDVNTYDTPSTQQSVLNVLIDGQSTESQLSNKFVSLREIEPPQFSAAITSKFTNAFTSSLNIFQPRQWPVIGSQLGSASIMRILRSYPRSVMRIPTFPPFIHPQCHSGYGINIPLAEPMAVCVSIAQIFSTRNEANIAFFWRAVRMEQERLLESVCAPLHISAFLEVCS